MARSSLISLRMVLAASPPSVRASACLTISADPCSFADASSSSSRATSSWSASTSRSVLRLISTPAFQMVALSFPSLGRSSRRPVGAAIARRSEETKGERRCSVASVAVQGPRRVAAIRDFRAYVRSQAYPQEKLAKQRRRLSSRRTKTASSTKGSHAFMRISLARVRFRSRTDIEGGTASTARLLPTKRGKAGGGGARD